MDNVEALPLGRMAAADVPDTLASPIPKLEACPSGATVAAELPETEGVPITRVDGLLCATTI